MNNLREAQQALAAMEKATRFMSDSDYKRLNETIEALRAALAEPVQEPYTDDVTRIMRDAGMTFHLGLPHKAVVEQMTRVVDLVYAEASIKAAQQFATPPQTAEPVQEPVAKVELMTTGGNAGLATRIVEIDDHLRERLRPGQLLYTTPPQREPLVDPAEYDDAGAAERYNRGLK
jgi:hypothetical protein